MMFLAKIGSSVEINVLATQQFNGHVVDRGHFLLHDDCVEERAHAGKSLHVGMLGNEERNAALPDAFGILWHHVVAHDLHVASVALQEKLAHDVGFRVEGDAMMHIGVRAEELFQYLLIAFRLVPRQADFGDGYIGEMVDHVVAESRLAVHLLLRTHLSVLQELHKHDLLLFRGDEHHHACGIVATLKGVLTVEGEGLQVGHVSVKQDKGDMKLVQLVGELARGVERRRNDDDTIGTLLHALACHLGE